MQSGRADGGEAVEVEGEGLFVELRLLDGFDPAAVEVRLFDNT